MNFPPSSVDANGFRNAVIPQKTRGLVIVTRLSDSTVEKAFCPGPPPGSATGLTWTDATYLSTTASFTSQGNNTYASNVQDGQFFHGAVVGPQRTWETSFVRMKYVAGQSSLASIGLHDSATFINSEQQRYTFFIGDDGNLLVLYRTPGGGQVIIISGIPAIDGNWYAFGRSDTQIFIETSSDGVNFDRLYTNPALYWCGNPLWFMVDMVGRTNSKLIMPQYAIVGKNSGNSYF